MPEPPQTQMFHLYLEAARETLLAGIRRVAAEQGIWTWRTVFGSDQPGVQVVELSVGDATLGFAPAEVRGLVAEILQG